jgi:L-lactate dehydrogenase complex protein LldF
MSNNQINHFKTTISEKLLDVDFQNYFRKNIDYGLKQIEEGINQFDDIEGCRERLSFLKKRVLNNLDKYLLEFENKFIQNGGVVYWADSVNDISRILDEIIPETPGIIVKSKSATCEEIQLKNFTNDKKHELIETDLGDFIINQMEQKRSHNISPAIHLSKEKIIEFFNKSFGTNKEANAEEITDFVRKLLRTKFFNSSIGISGANFVVADTGSVVITENEGNASLVTSWPKKHIVIAGIEKLIPSIKDLYLFLPMLSSHSTGQKLSVYNHIISGPARNAELDGPSEMAVIFINNNRHKLLEDIYLREALQCIHCGTCYSVCPVFKRLSGQAWLSVYNGPIGSVTYPHTCDNEENNFHLSYASTLCGKCSNNCPVKIPIHDLLVYNRHLAISNNLFTAKESRLIRMIIKRLKSRKSMDLWSYKIKDLAFKIMLRKSWLRHKSPVKFAEKSFNMIMTEKKK